MREAPTTSTTPHKCARDLNIMASEPRAVERTSTMSSTTGRLNVNPPLQTFAHADQLQNGVERALHSPRTH